MARKFGNGRGHGHGHAPGWAIPGEHVSEAPPEPTAESGDPESKHPVDPPSYVFFAIVAFVSAALDLGTKEWASYVLTDYDTVRSAQRTITVIPNLFDLQYAQNPGGAWSMLRSLPEIYRRPFFLFVATAASVFITNVYGKIDKRDWAMKWGLPLALGGAIGNLVDRIRHGFVVDFLHIFIKRPGRDFHWPTFNVADIWIVAGVILMGMTLFLGRKKDQPAKPERAPGEAGAS